jgi:hypothetical protein
VAQVKECGGRFRGEVTPTSAAGILLLADRHNLVSLEQVVMRRVLQEKGRYMANRKFKEEMKKEPDLLLELLSM